MPRRPLRLSAPERPSRPSADALSSALALLVASGAARSRAELVRATGLARSTVGAGLDDLLDRGLLVEAGEVPQAARGRPAQRLVLGPAAGVLLVVDLGTHGARLVISDLAQQVLDRDELQMDVAVGPTRVLEALADRLEALIAARGTRPEAVRALVIGLPAPVDVRGGVPVRPPIMPGWDGFPVAEMLRARLGCPVLVDNDANLMALGEARALPPDQSPLLLLKVSTGVGGGLVTADGRLHHGTDGAAGDIGHLRVPDAEHVRCACGNIGCVEAVASARAITDRLAELRGASGAQVGGLRVDGDDLQRLLRRGDAQAVALVKDAATVLGGVVATLVHLFNPSRVVVAGGITGASDHLLAGIRSVVYQQALPLATRNLTVAHSVLGDHAGLAGGIVTGIEHVLSPERIRGLAPLAP